MSSAAWSSSWSTYGVSTQERKSSDQLHIYVCLRFHTGPGNMVFEVCEGYYELRAARNSHPENSNRNHTPAPARAPRPRSSPALARPHAPRARSFTICTQNGATGQARFRAGLHFATGPKLKFALVSALRDCLYKNPNPAGRKPKTSQDPAQYSGGVRGGVFPGLRG